MTKLLLRQRLPSLLLTPFCPQCGGDIRLVRIEPAAPAYDLRTFECAPARKSTFVRSCPKADKLLRCHDCPLSANSGQGRLTFIRN